MSFRLRKRHPLSSTNVLRMQVRPCEAVLDLSGETAIYARMQKYFYGARGLLLPRSVAASPLAHTMHCATTSRQHDSHRMPRMPSARQ